MAWCGGASGDRHTRSSAAPPPAAGPRDAEREETAQVARLPRAASPCPLFTAGGVLGHAPGSPVNHPQTAREPVLVGLVAVAFALAFSYPVLGHLSEAGFRRDWDLLRQLDWAAFHSVTHFHQLPLWNPYKCGGMPLLANPHSRIVTPFFLLHLFLGPNVGLNLEVPLHLAISRRSFWPVVILLALGGFALGLAAIKLLPMEMLLRSHPRPVRIVESNPPGALWTALFSAQQAAFARGPGRWGFHEWGAYVGGLAGGLAVLWGVPSPRRPLPSLARG